MTTETKLSALQQDQLKRITAVLTGMGCKFGIITPDGEELGNLKVIKKKRGSPPGFAHGERSRYARSIISGMQMGQSKIVKCDERYTGSILMQALANTANDVWGKGTYIVAQRPEINSVEILYTGGI